jgi:hypothetical protein
MPFHNESVLTRRVARALSLALFIAACSSSSPTTPLEPTGEGSPVLFIGNSHTFTNDVPGILQALADSGGESIAVLVVAGASLALIDHWNLGTASDVIRSRSWDYVVMQQGWTPAGVCQDTLRLAARNFETPIRAAGATPVLFQTWPSANLPAQYQGTIESYRLAARDVNGMLFPVAEAWRELSTRDPSVNLYLDGLHANEAGAYLSALVMYARLFNRTPVGLPATVRTASGHTVVIPAPLAALLQDVAAQVGLAPTPDDLPIAEPVITSRC